MKRKLESTRLLGNAGAAGEAANMETIVVKIQEPVSLYRVEGIFAVNKPLEWTSNNVVSYIHGILEERNAQGTKWQERERLLRT